MKPTVHTKQDCPVTIVASMLSDTWTMLIIHNLLGGKVFRFCDLERTLEGISTRTLTLKLKTLEGHGLLEKTEAGYQLTAFGKTLRPVIRSMEQFGTTFQVKENGRTKRTR